jgi:hypothetical protein
VNCSRLLPSASRLVGLCAISALLEAQDVARFLPPDPMISLRAVGPREVGERMAETNYGRLLADPAAAPIRELPGKLLDIALEEVGDPRAEAHVRRAYELLRDYGGRMSAAASFDFDESSEDAIRGLLIGIVLEPDGKTDFAAVIEMFRDAANDAEMEQRTVGTDESGFTIARGDNRMELALPRVIDGHLVCYLGFDLEQAVARLGEQPAVAAETNAPDASSTSLMDLHVDVGRLVSSGALRAGSSGELDLEVVDAVVKRLGLKHFDMSLRADGEFFRSDYAISATAASSILDVLQPNIESTPIAMLAPPNHENWTTVRLDLSEILNLVRDVTMATRGDDLFELIDQLSPELGVDIRRDLIGVLDGQVLILNDSFAALAAVGEDDDEDLESAGLYSGVIGLRDSKAFDATLEKLLRSRGLHAARKTTEYRGVPIRTINAAIVQLSYAIVNEGIAFGVGRIGVDSVRSIIDASLAATDGQRQIRFPERFAERRRRLGEGWRDFQITSSSGYAGLLKEAVASELGDLEDEPDAAMVLAAVRPAIDAWLDLAPRFDLERNLAAMRLVPGRLEIVSIQ